MRWTMAVLVLLACYLSIYPTSDSVPDEKHDNTRETEMQLGNFSVGLTVKDVHVSKEFYEKLGFKQSGGDLKKNYIARQNGTSTIGLYQGMFEKNMLTYNPGWDCDCKTLDDFQDVRDIQQELKKRGLTPIVAADGPAHTTLVDSDGNPILLDQHVP